MYLVIKKLSTLSHWKLTCTWLQYGGPFDPECTLRKMSTVCISLTSCKYTNWCCPNELRFFSHKYNMLLEWNRCLGGRSSMSRLYALSLVMVRAGFWPVFTIVSVMNGTKAGNDRGELTHKRAYTYIDFILQWTVNLYVNSHLFVLLFWVSNTHRIHV